MLFLGKPYISCFPVVVPGSDLKTLNFNSTNIPSKSALFNLSTMKKYFCFTVSKYTFGHSQFMKQKRSNYWAGNSALIFYG